MDGQQQGRHRWFLVGGMLISIPIIHAVIRFFVEMFPTIECVCSVAFLIWTAFSMIFTLAAAVKIVIRGRRSQTPPVDTD
jgi:predicted tellurium resistance membrane protein TerC